MRTLVVALTVALWGIVNIAAAGSVYMPVGKAVEAPEKWPAFCAQARHAEDCTGPNKKVVDVVLTDRAWSDLNDLNKWVNNYIKPMTDMEHWGVAEKWSYPDDGYGDCEDYVLLKRRMLIAAGWPRAALLITVVRDGNDEGHAVLTVRTDRGEFILDDSTDDVLEWRVTGYKFVMRQSQRDQTVWLNLDDGSPNLRLRPIITSSR